MAANQFSSHGRRLTPAVLSGVLALTLGALPARAADFPEPVPYGAPREFRDERRPPPPVEEFGLERGPPRPIEPCRTVIRRRVTPEGEEIVKRVTICEERPDRFRFEREPRPLPPRLLPPRDVPPAYGVEGRSERGGYADERPVERFSGEDRLSEEPPLDERRIDERPEDGRGPDPRY
ncbi:hypothetical protein [Methylobacterium sp. 77]|uniref:hypothetical protein n=1 Tax=Methylobacterium sp. 77 TaxID=1101192 RepID=UPI00036F1D74|nr:hypothetical protein [Methylobacterium sp. 77]